MKTYFYKLSRIYSLYEKQFDFIVIFIIYIIYKHLYDKYLCFKRLIKLFSQDCCWYLFHQGFKSYSQNMLWKIPDSFLVLFLCCVAVSNLYMLLDKLVGLWLRQNKCGFLCRAFFGHPLFQSLQLIGNLCFYKLQFCFLLLCNLSLGTDIGCSNLFFCFNHLIPMGKGPE
jgi:hypothetical protein